MARIELKYLHHPLEGWLERHRRSVDQSTAAGCGATRRLTVTLGGAEQPHTGDGSRWRDASASRARRLPVDHDGHTPACKVTGTGAGERDADGAR